MSNIIVMNKNTVSTFKSKRTPEQNRREIIDADFKEIPEPSSEVVINPKKSSGNRTHDAPKEKIKYEYDGGKIVRGWFDDFVEKCVSKVLDKFMKK